MYRLMRMRGFGLNLITGTSKRSLCDYKSGTDKHHLVKLYCLYTKSNYINNQGQFLKEKRLLSLKRAVDETKSKLAMAGKTYEDTKSEFDTHLNDLSHEDMRREKKFENDSEDIFDSKI